MEAQCPQCGAPQPSGELWEQKLCPACLMKLGLSGAISAVPVQDPEHRRSGLRWNWRWAVRVMGGAVLIVLIAIAVRHYTEHPSPMAAVVRFSIDARDGMALQDVAVSPDGRSLAYTATTAEGESLLSLRKLDFPEPRDLAGAEGASMPFWSPDSQHIGFFAGGKLKTIRVDGGLPTTIADAPQPHGGSWSADSTIVFTPDSGGLQRVRSSGGEVTRVTASESSHGPRAPHSPQFLPDGIHFLFSASSDSAEEIRVGSLASGETRLVIRGGSRGIYSDGRILFVRDGVLMVQPFDGSRLEVSGEPLRVPYAESIGSRGSRVPYSVGGGVLAYRSSDASAAQSFLFWIDRIGKVARVEGEPVEQEDFAVSPDSSSVAVVRRASGSAAPDLWLLDLMRGATTRATFDARGAASPLWAPDGKRVAFVSTTASQAEIRTVAVDASSPPEMLLQLRENAVLDSWSPDGRFLLYTETGSSRFALWMLPLERDRKPNPFLKGSFNYKQARFSPDGRWVAYVSDESGRDEVYLREFPSGEGRSLVSVNGGVSPAWRRDGRELFYLSPKRNVTGVDVTGVAAESAGAVRVGSPRTLFQMPPGANLYEVAGDGRFLIAAPREQQQRSPINVVLHWTSEK